MPESFLTIQFLRIKVLEEFNFCLLVHFNNQLSLFLVFPNIAIGLSTVGNLLKSGLFHYGFSWTYGAYYCHEWRLFSVEQACSKYQDIFAVCPQMY